MVAGPFATAKQHLIACRNRAQTYPQKLPNAPSEFLEKIYLFLSPAALVWWLQTASIRHLIACRNRAQTYPQKLPNAPSEFLEKISLFLSPVCLLQLLFGSSKLQASGFQKGPFATAKQHLIACRNRAQTYPQKLPNAPSEFLEKISLFLSPVSLLQLLLGGSKLLASGFQKGPFATANQHLIPCRNRTQNNLTPRLNA